MNQENAARSRLVRRVEGRLRRTARKVRRSRAGRLVRPQLSVVMPFYDVEQYVAECLDSILEQDFERFELIAVDDGSRDGTRAVVDQYAAKDGRIRIVNRPNGGLGAARNTGVEHARGRFLTFVDSDDRLPPEALRLLVASAKRTGSDIVVGSVRRFDSRRHWTPEWVDRVHHERRERIVVTDFLPLLRNLYTWNKLFRKDFWDRQGLAFREGVAYEDQPVITQLLARASSIDVLSEVVYEYRARDDKSSISQQTASLRDLRFRVAAWEVSRDVLRAEASPEIYAGWLQTLFDSHFHWYLTSAGTVDDDYWALLRTTVCDLTEGAPQELWDRTPPAKRVLLALTRLDRRADAQEFVRLGAQQADRWPATPVEAGVLLHLPFFGDPDLADDLFLLRPDQLSVEHAIENVHWETENGESFCVVSGWGYIGKIDQAEHTSSVSVLLRSSGSGVEREFASTEQPEPAYFPPFDDDWCDYSRGTFRVRLPIDEVMRRSPPGESWEVLLRVTAAGFTVTAPVTHVVRMGSGGMIPTVALADGGRTVAPQWRIGETLKLAVQPLRVETHDLRLDGRVLSGRLSGPAASDIALVIVRSRWAEVAVKAAGGSFRVALPEATGLTPRTPVTWEVFGRLVDDSPVGLAVRSEPDVFATTATGALVVRRSRLRELTVTEYEHGAVVDGLEATPSGVLKVRGRLYGPAVETVALMALSKKGRTQGPDVAPAEGRFETELELTAEVYRFGVRPLSSGEHDVWLRVRPAGGGAEVEIPVAVTDDLTGAMPIRLRTDRLEGLVVRGPQGGVRLLLIRPLGDARGRYRQNELRQQPHSGGLTRGLLLRSYFGESATDNGVSIQKELQRRGSDLPVYWAVHDHSIVVPDGGIPVIVNSREWYQLLGSVKYYVDNMYQPEYYRKPPGQVVAQTFHGYPFKRMGHPHWQNLQFSQARIAAYDKRAAEWDYLVSPARYATPLLTRDFNYHGEVLEIGYPRNDVLQSPEADQIRVEVRRSLGIRADQVAVLYAPTFRDYLAEDDMVATMADFFDFEQAMRALGSDFVLLVRGHAFNARDDRRVEMPGVVEVTDYPEVSDLYLAADAAVVDYSSLRFDFGVTRKPMIFHVPDLQRYKDTRGWLFDFEPSAPGPLCETTEQVVAELRDLDGVRARHRDDYRRFRSEFLDLEDGHAGRRFVESVFVPRGDA